MGGVNKQLIIFFSSLLSLVCLLTVVAGQEKLGPLGLEQIESVLADLPPARVATIIRDRGVSFEVTDQAREKLRKAGADALVMQAVERAGVEYPKRKAEEQKIKLEEERRKIEEEKRNLNEARLKEEERKRLDLEEKRREDERRRIEQEGRRLELERQTLTEEKLKVKTEAEKLEEQRRKSPQIKPDSEKESPSRPMLVPLAP